MKPAYALFFVTTLACGQLVNPDISQANIDETICVSGWTATVRPPVSYTNKVKRGLMEELGIEWARAGEFELDHWLPLAVGGHPSDPRNLRLQVWTGPRGARAKDVVEAHVHRQVCKGELTLEEGQACFFTDWRNCAKGK